MKNIKNILIIIGSFLMIDGSCAIDHEPTGPKSKDIHTKDYSNMSTAELDAAFILAVAERNVEIIEKLIEAGANVNTPVRCQYTIYDWDRDDLCSAMLFAVRKNYPDIIEALLKVKGKLNEPLTNALKEAIDYGRQAVLRALIEGGVDINDNAFMNSDSDKDTPLIYAIKYSGMDLPRGYSREERQQIREAIVHILLKAGAKVTCVNKEGKTALMSAVEKLDLNTVESLLEIPEIGKGSFFGFGTKPINYADMNGDTALILAIKSIKYKYYQGDNAQKSSCINSQKIAELLLKFPGINHHHGNNNGETAITLLEKLKREQLDEMNRARY